ncbi:LXG domain-containing protein [Enterococcus mundtii]|uniref:LXG domain-containing protein n=1 Tax=Enterococcus mundtii TaxID=53346 RepID=UPI001F49AD25|nr:LXG domain-containing protein [Enterococcus mundtii]
MSIDMYLNDSLTQATSARHFCQKQVTDYQNLQQAITQFTLQTPNLQGKTYDAAKAYFSQVLYPLVQGGILLSKAVEKAAKRFPQQYIEQVDSISLKQSELEAQIRQMNQYITQAEGIRQLLLSPHMPEEHQSFQLNQNTLLLTMYHDLKHKLEEKLQKLLAYNQSSALFFTEIKSLEQAVNQGLAQTKTAWNSQTKTFSIPKDLSWITTIQDKWQQAENEKKGIDPTKNKELEKYNVYTLIIHDSDGNPLVFWKIEDKQSGYGIVNPELYQYVTKVGHYLEPELIQFMTYDTYQEKVNVAWRQGVNYETGEKLDPLLGSLVSTSQYVKDGYTWINESELGQALMILAFTYASYKVLTTTGVKQVENDKIEDVSGIEFNSKTKLEVHFSKHGSEIQQALNKNHYSIVEYLRDANHVIKEGQFVPEMNGYIKLVGGEGSAKYAFVGLDRTTGNITTLHLKSVKELIKKAPSLGLK